MQRRKYFFRRFRQYLLLFLLPVTVVIIISFLISVSQLSGNQKRAGRDLVNAVNTDVELSLNNISQQNVQFANNAYMVLSLKRILEKGDYLSYADSINIRSINATLKSAIITYPYVDSIYLYMDGYDYYYTSDERIARLTRQEEWYQYYENMGGQDTEIWVLPADRDRDGEARELTVMQKMPFFSGVVVMRINLSDFRNLLSSALLQEDTSVVFINMDNDVLFCWGDDTDASALSETALPGDGNPGVWEMVGEHLYLLQQSDNASFGIRIVAMTPVRSVLSQAARYLPSWGLMLAAGIAAALLATYVTTSRNFGYIEHIISVLGDAERGNYSRLQDPRKTEDEYDTILNNIIRLHLETERLSSELEQKKHQQEVVSLTALQAQINPHFMFNTLQMIQFKAAGGGRHAEDVVRMTEALSDILRYALSDPLQPITLREEIEYLKKYVAIQHMRFGQQFILYYEVEEEQLDLPVFRLMLQPIIENSILHGIRDKGETGYIKLTVFQREDVVRFRVFDTGVGMSPERLEQLRRSINTFDVHSIGLSNVNSRLKLYFGEEAGLRIRSVLGRGTIVEFQMKLSQIEKYVNESKKLRPDGKTSEEK